MPSVILCSAVPTHPSITKVHIFALSKPSGLGSQATPEFRCLGLRCNGLRTRVPNLRYRSTFPIILLSACCRVRGMALSGSAWLATDASQQISPETFTQLSGMLSQSLWRARGKTDSHGRAYIAHSALLVPMSTQARNHTNRKR